MKRCEAAIEAYRDEIDTRKAENYGFASMAAVPYAHIVARMLEGKNPRGTTVTLAPNPKDLVSHLLVDLVRRLIGYNRYGRISVNLRQRCIANVSLAGSIFSRSVSSTRSRS